MTLVDGRCLWCDRRVALDRRGKARSHPWVFDARENPPHPWVSCYGSGLPTDNPRSDPREHKRRRQARKLRRGWA